jgi:regulator of sigma E protease
MIHAAISAAGPIANLVLALFLYAGLSLATGEISFLPVASTIEPASAAEKAGFREGDVIISADGITVTSFEELRPILASRDQPVRFEIHRHDERLTLTATLSHLNVHGRSIGHLGISSHEMRTRSVGLREAFKLGVERSWQASVATVALCGYSIRTAAAPNPLATAINVAGLSRSASALGFPQLVACAAFLSVVLALSNLLPMPMLDGGAILVDIAELVRRRPASPATLVFIDRAGLAVIAILFAFSSRHGLLV